MKLTNLGMPTLIETNTLPECAKLCAELGLDFIELNMNMPAFQLDKIDVDYFRSIADKYGIYYTIHLDENLNVSDFNPYVADSQVIPYFRKHNIYLEKLKREDIQGYINEKYKNGRVDGKGGLSAKSIKTHMIVIRQAIKEAMRDKLISNNPAEFVVMPKMQRRNVDFYTESELNILFEAIKNEPLYYFYYFSIIFGLRRSETLGLKWDSISFENGMITINHTVVKFSTIVQKDCTKSDASYRAFPMMQEIKDILVELKQQEETNRKLFGKDYIENDYIFKKVNGEPYRPDYVSKKFGNLLKKNGLRKIRLHDLRYSCASLLATNGYNMKDIQEWLGHKDIQTTVNIKNPYEQLKESKQLDYLC